MVEDKTVRELLHEIVDQRFKNIEEYLSQLMTRVSAINDRTKSHTKDIKGLQRREKENEK